MDTWKDGQNSRPPITYVTPNLLELTEIYRSVKNSPFDLFSHPAWWTVMDAFNLGSKFRTDLENLSRRDCSNLDSCHDTLSFLVADGVAQMAIHLLPFFQNIIIKCGDKGVVLVMRVTAHDSPWAKEQSNVHNRLVIAQGRTGGLVALCHFPALTVSEIKNVTGAGDTFVGALLAEIARNPDAFFSPSTVAVAIEHAQRAAGLTLQSEVAVSPLLSQAT